MHITVLSNKDRDVFLSLHDQEPNEALKKAAKRLENDHDIHNWLSDMREAIDHNGS